MITLLATLRDEKRSTLTYFVIIVVLSVILLMHVEVDWINSATPKKSYIRNGTIVEEDGIEFENFEPIYNHPHSSDLGFMLKASPNFNYTDEYIPLINVFNRAGVQFMERFVRSIDFPTETLMIVQDSLEDTRLFSLIRTLRNDPSVQRYIKNIRHVVNVNNTGCAQGWNTVMRLYPGEPFYIFSANDILLPPGGLQVFYNKVRDLQQRDPQLGLVSAKTFYGTRRRGWTTEEVFKTQFNAMFWVYTRQGILRSGLYDENFYPGYYEDDEIIYRNFVSGMKSQCISEVVVTHGYPSGYYRTGTKLEDRKNLFASEVKRSTNQKYMQTKWGPTVENGLRKRAKEMFNAGYETFRKYCGRFDEDVPPKFRGFYCTPYNQSMFNPNQWWFHPSLRECIRGGAEGNTCDKYLVDFLSTPNRTVPL